jgi:hypothetical protein
MPIAEGLYSVIEALAIATRLLNLVSTAMANGKNNVTIRLEDLGIQPRVSLERLKTVVEGIPGEKVGGTD